MQLMHQNSRGLSQSKIRVLKSKLILYQRFLVQKVYNSHSLLQKNK